MTSSMSAAPKSATDPAAGVVDVAWLAVGGAVVASLCHTALIEIRFRVLREFTFTSREFAWLSLAGYLTWFLCLAVPLAALAILLRRWVRLRAVVTFFVALAVFSVLLLNQRIHPLAQLVLASGLGSVAGAWFAKDHVRWMRRTRRLTIGGVVALGVTGLLGGGRLQSPKYAESPAVAAAPNIVLLILDTVRAANLSLYGYARETTPELMKLARESTVFDRAFSAAPWTAPSHASMMTGLWASQAGADYLRPMHDSLTTVAQVLGGRGYLTGGFVANTGYAGYQLGISHGFGHYEDFPFSFQQALWSTTLSQTGSGQAVVEGILERENWKFRQAFTHPDFRTVTVRKAQPQTAAEIANHFFAWRDRFDKRAYFAMLNFMDAHAPYEPPGTFRTRFNEGRKEVDRYDGGIAYEDSIIGTIVDRLRARGDLENTVLIVTSDHGEQWGEHGLESHGNSLYLPLLRVPLLVRAPGRVPAGQRVDAIVSLRDLAATLVALGGAGPGTLPGASLESAWTTGRNIGLSPVMAEAAAAVNPSKVNLTRFGPMKSSLDSAGHYIHYGNGTDQYFNWRTDSAELDDRAATPEGQAAMAQHRLRIGRLLGTGWPPPRAGLH